MICEIHFELCEDRTDNSVISGDLEGDMNFSLCKSSKEALKSISHYPL